MGKEKSGHGKWDILHWPAQSPYLNLPDLTSQWSFSVSEGRETYKQAITEGIAFCSKELIKHHKVGQAFGDPCDLDI